MDIKALRDSVGEHPESAVIRMADGTEYRLPHRDDIWFTPHSETSRSGYATSFWLHDPEKDVTRLVNAMLVKVVSPLRRNGGAEQHGRTRRTKR